MTEKKRVIVLDDGSKNHTDFVAFAASLIEACPPGVQIIHTEMAAFEDIQEVADEIVRKRDKWDRGGAGPLHRGEGLRAMMERLGAQRPPPWITPHMIGSEVCCACDGAPDGGHTREVPCGYALEDLGWCPELP